MLELITKPECFKELEDSHIFYSLKDEKGLYGYLALYLASDAVIHLEVFRFSVDVMKHMIKEWEFVKNICKRAKCKKIIALGKPTDNKWRKFVKIFGFPEPKYISMTTMEV